MYNRRHGNAKDRRTHDIVDRRSSNVVWTSTIITKERRNLLNNQRSAILWFTGLSGSGKSTIADALEKHLHEINLRTYILDGDNIRHGLCGDLSFSDADRKENIRRIGEVSKLFVDAGVMVLTSFISPFKSDRNFVRSIVHDTEFIEIHVKCPLELCERRDVKGLYQKARTGEIKQFTGIDSPYEQPNDPEIVLDTSKLSIKESVDIIYNYLIRHSYIKINRREKIKNIILDTLIPNNSSL
ncbi:MAG: adenylyl-sulfate kinase [Gammaproteobacteria bacterium]|nr:adenylyl-sulfate kinase [Gammaproteobacteria bacterium]